MSCTLDHIGLRIRRIGLRIQAHGLTRGHLHRFRIPRRLYAPSEQDPAPPHNLGL